MYRLQRVSNEVVTGGERERKRERIPVRSSRRGEERDAGFRAREESTNGVANEYRVWIREEPIGVRDVLPRSREKRQSGVLIGGIALG